MIFICLGNKGEKYKGTRHNAGRMFGEFLLEKFKCSNIQDSQEGKIWELENGWRVVFLDCYMNETGLYLKGLMKVRNWKIENLVIVHDDLDIPLGEFKIQTDRGSAGHRGVESIINALVTSSFRRIRIGIDRPDKIPEEKYVLMHFSSKEQEKLENLFENILIELERK